MAYREDDYISIDLLTGLPPAHLALQKDTFAAYFKAGDGIDFDMNGKPYHVIIDSVQVYPQGFAAVLPCFKEIKETPYSFIVDIGGMTVDYLQLANGKPNLEVCSSLEKGIIKLYSDINRRLITDAGEELTERQIDAAIKGKYHPEMKELIDSMCRNYVRDLLNQLREEAGNFKSAQLYFVGGGSNTLRRYIENCYDLIRNPHFINDVLANAKGYEILYQSKKKA